MLMNVRRSLPRRALQIGTLTLAGIAYAGLFISYHDYGAQHWTPPGRWWAVFFCTMAGFSIAVEEFRSDWAQVFFWLTAAGLLVVHLLAFAAVLWFAPELPLPWFAIATAGEVSALVWLLRRLGFGRHIDGPF
jgi:hypothetical protein